jgi:hypothetical protein
LGLAASTLDMTRRIVEVARSPSVEFAVQVQICSQADKPILYMFSGVSRSRTLERQNLLFPRYSFVSTDSIEMALTEIMLDVFSAAGVTTKDRIVSMT